MPLTLQNGTHTIKLVETLGAPSKTALTDVIYTPGLAVAVLHAQGLTARTILNVTPDLTGTDVTIEFYADENRIKLKTAVHCQEFLVPLRLRRVIKSGAYKLAPMDPQQAHQLTAIAEWLPLAPGATITAVYENEHRPAQLVVCEPTDEEQTRCRCTCADAQTQLQVLPLHPALWQAAQSQPLCKHLLRHGRG